MCLCWECIELGDMADVYDWSVSVHQILFGLCISSTVWVATVGSHTDVPGNLTHIDVVIRLEIKLN